MEHTIQIQLPAPPRAKRNLAEDESRAEDVIVNFLSGKTDMCQLIRYQESEKTITLFYATEDEKREVRLDEIKSVQLVNSRHFVLDDHYLTDDHTQVTMPSERQEYHVTFIDDQTEVGETLGHTTDENGIHLYIAQAFYNYYHMFIPQHAIKDQRIGPVLGKALVENKFVNPDDLEKGLDTQAKLRNQKLGEYLTSQEILTSEELERAIKRQQSTPNLRLGEALIQEQLITPAQLENALLQQKSNRSKPLGEILINMGAVSKDDMKKTLATKLGIPYVNLKKFNVDMTVISMVPEKICRRHNIVPLSMYEGKLIVAIENPLNRVPVEDLRFHTKTFVEPVMASPEEIEWAIGEYYGSKIDILAQELADDEDEDESTEAIAESDNTLVKLVNKMITDAHAQGVSDIHIEPYPGKENTTIRFRKDGELHTYVELSPSYRKALVSRIKIMCDLDISERRKPQDGKIDFKRFGPLRIELRVATIPTANGLEDVVLRILANGEPIPLDQLGLRSDSYNQMSKLITSPYGLFLVCGPTGSGKTTTLHSALGTINTNDKKIWTAEDPVEITQKGLRQVQINNKIDLTFANAMRSFLRADPDIIMVGEMRDEETASTAIEASLTGHFVLSTLHTNSAPESIVRLLEMGMDPFNFADALVAILAQRLTKRLCLLCKKPRNLSEKEIEELADEFFSDYLKLEEADVKQAKRTELIDCWKKNYGRDGELVVHEAFGCEECGNTGYDGRLALHELLVTSEEIKHLIHEQAPVTRILKTALSQGMITLKQDGIEKSLQGQTDMHQVRAVCIK